MASKVVTVRYGLFNNPHTKNIEKTIDKWRKKGYELKDRSDHNPGCVTTVVSLFLARGKTELTFVKSD